MSAITLRGLLRISLAAAGRPIRRLHLRYLLNQLKYELAYVQRAQGDLAREEQQLHLRSAMLNSDLRALEV